MIDDEFAGGQRWISEAEPELGLGTVFSCDSRRVTLLFQASGEVRHYPRQEAPLRRVRFRPGQFVQSYEGWSLQVEMVEEHHGVLIYRGEGRSLPETELSEQSGFRTPVERLLGGPRDGNDWFALRLESLRHRHGWEAGALRGLVGARLAPRDGLLALARTVGERTTPRVIISDPQAPELIQEAGMILHRRWCQRRDGRVLLLVRQAAVPRWRRELLGRFQLPCSVVDDTHCRVLEADGVANPFADEALALVALEWLASQPRHQLQLLAVDWQLLVVDGVQQLDWQAGRPGTDFLLVAELCERIPGVLLLAPGGAGEVEDFPPLHLLDPVVFADPAVREAQRARDRQLVRLARALAAGHAADAADLVVLAAWPDSEPPRAALAGPRATDREALLAALRVRHSTASLWFDGVRTPLPATWSVQPVALPCPPDYCRHNPCPERDYRGGSPWWRLDPRVAWLLEQLPVWSRALVICTHASTARELHAVLERAEVTAGCLHEQLTPLARDRAVGEFQAARATAVLICAEPAVADRELPACGHLLLFDLPPEPARLMHRLAAMGGSGAAVSVTLHLPYLEGTAQAVLYHWYREGLVGLGGCPRPLQPSPALAQRLTGAMSGAPLPPLLALSRELRERALARQEAARACLGEPDLWYPPAPDGELRQALEALERDPRLADYLGRLLRLHGVRIEPQEDGVLRLAPGEHWLGAFPGVPDTGTLVTFSRAQALLREEPLFLSWDHPVVGEAMARLLGGEQGNACVVAWMDSTDTPELLLEAIYVVESPVAAELQVEALLPPTPLRVVVDADFAEVAEDYPHESINHRTAVLDDGAVRALLGHHRELLEALLEVAEINAQMRQHDLLDDCHHRIQATLREHCQALEAGRRLNPAAVPDRALAVARQRLARLDEILPTASLRLDALRLVVGQG